MNVDVSKNDMPLVDRRIRRTQRALAEALVQLTLERGFDAITIRDITDRADIGYATFFRHYADKDALLLDVVDVFLEQIFTLLRPHAGRTDDQSLLLFNAVEEHADLCRVLLSGRGSPAIGRRIRDLGMRDALQSAPQSDAVVPPEIAAHHVVEATIALIHWWLEHNRPYPPERMAEIHTALILHPVYAKNDAI